MNSGVCIKGSWWEDQAESDYYGLLEEVIKLSYVGSNSVILFKCQWFDNNNGMKVDKRHGIIEIKHGSKAYVNEPFVLAAQAAQVYYTPFASRERGRKDWWAVCKTKSRAVQYALEEEEEPQLPEFFQEDETIGLLQSFNDDELDAPGFLLHEDDQYEEVEPTEIGLKHNPPQEDEDEEQEEEEVEEEEENDKESEEDSEGYQSSEEAD